MSADNTLQLALPGSFSFLSISTFQLFGLSFFLLFPFFVDIHVVQLSGELMGIFDGCPEIPPQKSQGIPWVSRKAEGSDKCFVLDLFGDFLLILAISLF